MAFACRDGSPNTVGLSTKWCASTPYGAVATRWLRVVSMTVSHIGKYWTIRGTHMDPRSLGYSRVTCQPLVTYENGPPVIRQPGRRHKKFASGLLRAKPVSECDQPEERGLGAFANLVFQNKGTALSGLKRAVRY